MSPRQVTRPSLRVRRTRQQVADDNTEALLDAARRVFAARGYHATSLDTVALEAGLTKGAIYARFESKDELMLTLLDSHIDTRLAEVRRAAAAAVHQSPEDVARAIARQWMERAVNDRAWTLLTLEFRLYAARSRSLSSRFVALHQRFVDGIADVLTAAWARAGQRPPRSPVLSAHIGLGTGTGMLLEQWATTLDLQTAYEDVLAALAGEPADPPPTRRRR